MMLLRKVIPTDCQAIELVERLATPNLQYLPRMFSEFANDRDGEFIVAEVDGVVGACGKFTVMPDGTAWLEALRVMPEYQGKGIGKAFYRRFFEIATEKGIRIMRMYTGTRNAASKGLAELNGFRVAGTYRGSSVRSGDAHALSRFKAVDKPSRATELLMPLKDIWTDFFVMNRTFYEVTPALCEYWARQGMVYEDSSTDSVVVAGARFMPENSLHLAAFAGDTSSCLSFAAHLAMSRGVNRIDCLFPLDRADMQGLLVAGGFEIDSDFIVMEVRL